LTASPDHLTAQLLALRENFDRSFAQARSAHVAPGEHLLAIRVGRDPYALRSNQIAMIGTDRQITTVPSDSPELLGIAGLRGALVAVYDLALLIGVPRGDAPRWLARCKGSELAFAFGAFDGHVQLRPDDLARAGPGSHPLLGEVARVDGVARPIIPLLVLSAMLDRQARPTT